MSLMKRAAVKGIIPSGNKVSELRSSLIRLMTEIPTMLEEQFGEDGAMATAEIFRRLGSEDAQGMRERLGLGSTLRDALDGWVIIGHVMGAKMEVTWSSKTKASTGHLFCPQHRMYADRGKIYCDIVCLPYVEAFATEINPKIAMEVDKPADMNAACVKSLVISE